MFKREKTEAQIRFALRQKKVTELVDKMLSSNVEVHTAPYSNEYFILDREKQVYAIIDNSFIRVCNHIYRYEIPISGNESDKYIKKVKKKLQSHSQMIKKELFKNEIDLVDRITDLYE